MARVVCQVLSQPDRLTLIWSEGDAFFEPYHLSGAALADLRQRAARIRDTMADLAGAQPEGAEGFHLAKAGHDLYQQLFLMHAVQEPNPAREVRDWLSGLEAAGALDSIEILADAPDFIPWNIVLDRPDATKSFWGVRLNLALGRRADPLRQLSVLEEPEVLLAINPDLRDALPADQRNRLAEFAKAHNLSVVNSKEALTTAIQARAVNVLYLFCTAVPNGFLLGEKVITSGELRDLVRGIEDDSVSSPLLFLNACRGSEVSSVLATLQAVGLTGFVAAELPLPANVANAQGLDVLAAFLYQGEPLGSLLQRVRARTNSLSQWYTGVCWPDLRVRWASGVDEAVKATGAAPAPPTVGESKPVPLPDTPYRPLAPYDMEDRPLFVGRDGDVERFASLLDDAATRLLVLHGPGGVGKSSMLRAGVIPYLEEDSVGYRFLRDRSETDDESAPEADFPVLAIRATLDLPGQVAQALCAYCARPYSFITPTGRKVVVDLPAVLSDLVGSPAGSARVGDEEAAHREGQSTTAVQAGLPAPAAAPLVLPRAAPAPREVEVALRRDTTLLARALAAFSERLPQELVLLVEQAEEMFTLAPDARSRHRGADLLRPVLAVPGHFKIIVSVRTEFFGRLNDQLGRDAEGSARSYLLGELDADTIAEAILLPTAREPIPYTDDVPFEKYGFAFEEGLAKLIAADAVAAAREGQENALPLVQVVCGQLAGLVKERADRVIRTSDLRAIKGVAGALAHYVEVLITDVSGAKADRRALRALMENLYTRQADGTLCRDLVPESELANGWRGAASLEEVVDAGADDSVRLLDVTWLTDRGAEERSVSLSHDALLPVVARWQEEDERRSYTRKRVVDTLFITVPCILLALVLAYRFYTRATGAEKRSDEGDTEVAKELRQLKEKEEGYQSARWTTYVGRMGQARQALEAGSPVTFDQALQAARDLLKDETDLRGFEWYYLQRLGHGERATLAGHQGLVTSVALSPDGRVMASASADGTVKLWDAATGLERATLAGAKGPVNAVAFSGDGKYLASAGADGILRLWDPATGKGDYLRTDKTLATIPGNGGGIRALAFTPDGKTLAAAGVDKKDMRASGVIRLWDVKERTETKTLTGHDGPVNALAFTPDGKLLVSAGEDRAVVLWDVAKGQKLKTLAGHPGAVHAVAFSADGKMLASGGLGRKDGVDIGVVHLWEVATGKERGNFNAMPAGVFALAFASGGKELLTGGRSHVVQVWDAASGTERRALRAHRGWVRALAVSADGKTLATGSYDRTSKLWDLQRGANPEVLGGPGDWICSLAVSPGGAVIAAGTSNGTFNLWDATKAAVLGTEKGHTGSVVALAISPKGDLMASGSWDETKGAGELTIRDLKTGKKRSDLAGHAKGVTCAGFSPDGRILASGGADGKVILWDPETGEKKQIIEAHNVVRSLAFSPAGHVLATGGNDARIRLWDSLTGKEQATSDPRTKGALRVAPLEGHTGPVLALAFAPHRFALASASADTTVKLWDVAAGAARATLRGHGGVVFSVAFSPGGETLASGGGDRTIKLWDTDTGAERYTLTGHAGPVRAVAFFPDSAVLASGSHDGTVRLWRAAPPEPMVMVPPQE